MNYNEEYRTPRDRVSHNSSWNDQHSGCGCHSSNNATRVIRNTRKTDCGCHKAVEHTHHQPDCTVETKTERIAHDTPSCCERTTTPCCDTRNTTPNRPKTVCTTVPVEEGCVDTYPVAMAYVPMQQWRDLYDPISALTHGTIFRELDLDWYPANCRKDNCK